MLKDAGFEIGYTVIVPDEQPEIERALKHCADELDMALVVTTGGTGFSPRDVTPEATVAVCDRMAPGIPEAMRYESLKITNRAMLTRQQAGIRKRTLIINLPGSPKAIRENFAVVLPALDHGLEMLRDKKGDCAAT
jgi:molybdenum cofactor synthesis domain-containing protein